MVRLIEGQRAYEASARTLTMQDEQTGSMINTYGR
jgi:flagellar basal-body rod protein FlgG